MCWTILTSNSQRFCWALRPGSGQDVLTWITEINSARTKLRFKRKCRCTSWKATTVQEVSAFGIAASLQVGQRRGMLLLMSSVFLLGFLLLWSYTVQISDFQKNMPWMSCSSIRHAVKVELLLHNSPSPEEAQLLRRAQEVSAHTHTQKSQKLCQH